MFRYFAVLGCVIIVLANLFDPFLQQVVVYPSRRVSSENIPIIVRSELYAAQSYEGLPLPSVIDLSMKAAIYSGIFDIQGKAERGVSHTCPSGDCEWDSFTSLAVCSKCVNITAYIQKTCTEDRCPFLSLPDGPSLSIPGNQINTSVTNITSSLSSVYSSVLRFSSLVSEEVNSSQKAIATECSMFYCVQKIAASVTDGVVSQKVLSTWRNDSATGGDGSDLIYVPPTSFSKSLGKPKVFNVTHVAAKAMKSFMSETFTGSGGLNGSESAFSSDVIQSLYSTQNLTKRIENLAISMSNNIREQNDSAGNAQGIAWENETYVHVRWKWFTFPAILLFFSVFFLIGAIFETTYRDIKVWKSSNLALLFHGRSLELSNHNQSPLNKISEMAERANNTKIELIEAPEGNWKLVQI